MYFVVIDKIRNVYRYTFNFKIFTNQVIKKNVVRLLI